MADTKFTPGPWEIYRDNSGSPVAIHTSLDGDVDSDTGQHIIVGGDPIVTIADTEDCEDNASLIAAAPALYKEGEQSSLTLREMANVLRGTGHDGCASICDKAADNMDAALKIARGEL